MSEGSRQIEFRANPTQKAFIESQNDADLFACRMGEGKALALDTPIPTVNGWKRMEDIVVGDHVFDEHGQPCMVRAVSEIMEQRPCYCVRFSDGAELIADAYHQWETTTHNRPERNKTAIRTTKEIAESLEAENWSNKWNHRVKIAGALSLPEKELPIPPYTLGAWLGDGNSRDSRITVADSDVELLSHLRADGTAVSEKRGEKRSDTVGNYKLGDRLVTVLRIFNLLQNKHIPDDYLRASYEQRLQLLRGLLDTDGTISEKGQVELVLSSSALAFGALELVRSLGLKVGMTVSPAKLYGRVVGTRHRIRFRAYNDVRVFNLKRKADRQPDALTSRSMCDGRMIVECERVASVPVKCIAVDSPSSLFLAGEHLVPTHNSAALAWAIWYHTRHNPGARWAVVRDTWENLRDTTQQELFKWFPPGIFGDYKASEKKFVWKAETGLEGEILFMGMDDPDDASKLQSRELAGIAMDEPAPAAESGGIDELIFDVALSRLRQPNMNWYAIKLAENNPDETHWTYRRFVEPGTEGFVCWQTSEAENLRNLPENYYEKIAQAWAHRPDLKRRFLEGKFGFQQIGRAVTPEWSSEIHLTGYLEPVRGCDLIMSWDGGLNPTCVITQVTPLGDALILEAHVGEHIGMYELITQIVKPRLASVYEGFRWRHTGDPNLESPEQSSSQNSAALVIQRALGGPFIAGPVSEEARTEPLRALLGRQRSGRGVLQVDRYNAKAVWHALRGGWHYHVDRNGNIGGIVKDEHSHPGDCCMEAGTRILLERGWTPIESVEVGDVAITPWTKRPITFSGPTRYTSRMIELRTARGRIRVTEDHMIFTQRGLLRADAVRYGDTIGTDASWEKTLWVGLRSLFTGATSTGFLDVITGGTSGHRTGRATCTGPSGNTITARFLRAITSTISTATRSTTPSRIWNASPLASTSPNIPDSPIPGRRAKATRNTCRESDTRPLNGIAARKVGDGIQNMEGTASSNANPSNGPATNVERGSRPYSLAAGSVPESARQRIGAIVAPTMKRAVVWCAALISASTAISRRGRVLGVVHSPSEGETVYDITVDTDHCLYAEGLLVKNCGYFAAYAFPLAKMQKREGGNVRPKQASFFGRRKGGSSGIGSPGARPPKEARTIGED